MIAARLCARVLRALGKGGTSLPGRLALKMKYDVLTRLAKNTHTICVTGTNGKTTTCALLEHALKSSRRSYLINKSGANMLGGVTTAFLMNSSLFGVCKKEFAILECDENSLPLISRYIDAEAVVVTNVFRDQLDRYGEVSHTLNKICEGIENMPKATLFLNADDPLTFSIKKRCNNRTVTFGVDAKLPPSALSDSSHCPQCGATLAYQSHTLSQLGDFRCPRCGFHRCTPDFLISGITNSSFLFNGKLYSTSLGGMYNLYNFSAAGAVTETLGFGSAEALCSFSGAFGRMEHFSHNGRTVLLMLVKNPVGLTGCISYVCKINGALNLAFALNDNSADGRDVSWIWDSDFAPVKEKCRLVYTVGTRAEDMALRLKYDGITVTEIIEGENYRRLLALIQSSTEDFIVFSTYTSMMKMRHLFIDCFGGKEFWE